MSEEPSSWRSHGVGDPTTYGKIGHDGGCDEICFINLKWASLDRLDDEKELQGNPNEKNLLSLLINPERKASVALKTQTTAIRAVISRHRGGRIYQIQKNEEKN